MMCYPILSVFPQGILACRGLFYARYAPLFGSGRRAWLAGALAPALHLVFMNVWAVALTFCGGLFINRTYRKTSSLLASGLEHALYGQLVFYGLGPLSLPRHRATAGARNVSRDTIARPPSRLQKFNGQPHDLRAHLLTSRSWSTE